MKRNNRFILITIFILLLISISLGYSKLMATLSIDGDVTIKEVTWNMFLDNIQIKENSFTNNNSNIAKIDENNNKKIICDITLNEPGDFYEFSFDIVNNGTLNGKISNIIETGTTIEEINLLDYIDYSMSNMPIINRTVISADDRVTVTIRLEYLDGLIDNEEEEEIQYDSFSFEKTIELEFEEE